MAGEEVTAEVWHALAAEEVLARVGSGAAGLDAAEAQRRLDQHGANVIQASKGPGPWRVLARQFQSPIVFLLLGATAVAWTLGKTTDGVIVLLAVLVNVLIGFVQEYRAGKAVAALSRMVPQRASVTRSGALLSVPVEELVPGDVIHLDAGDRVPADGRLLAARGLRVEEAALTGESVPVDKAPPPVERETPLGDRRSMVYGGTLVAGGTARAVVTSTGGGTELGRISALLEDATQLETPLTQALARVGRWLSVAVLALSALLFGAGLLRGYSVADGLLVAVTLAVATIPEGLPAIVTVALAVAVQRMARRRAIVRRLPSVETLGSTTVICTDKTGTLTRNEMTVQALLAGGRAYQLTGVGYEPRGQLQAEGQLLSSVPPPVHDLLATAILCNDASLFEQNGRRAIAGDPTEGALVVAAEKIGIRVDDERRRWHREDVIPFESEHQFMATLHRDPQGRRMIALKGAPEVVLARCRFDAEDDRRRALDEAHRMAARGLRVLAIAIARPARPIGVLDTADVAQGLTLLGLAGLMDPPRPEAIAAVQRCRTAGVAVKMITGDHAGTAQAIGVQLGLAPAGGRAVTGAELATAADHALERIAADIGVFARVAPEHKLRLVRALQRRGQVVAMTGDGVNDAPAIKQANVGVAMGITGSAVSKEASDVVLADDNFATIAAAVEEGRRVYDNLIKSMAFVLPTNLAMGLVLAVAVLAFPLVSVGTELLPLMPASPSQLLWVNLVTSVALSLPLAFEVPEPDLMSRPPRPPGQRMLGSALLARMAMAALVMCAAALGVFWWEYLREAPRVGHAVALGAAQTMAVTAIVFAQIGYLFNCRGLHDSRRMGLFSNPSVFAGIALLLSLHAAFIYLPALNRVLRTAPLDLSALGIAAGSGLAIVPVVALEKAVRTRLGRARRSRREGGLALEGAAS